jgi:hypothetical protein
MKVELRVAERILLLSALPSEGNVLTLRLVRDLKDQLAFGEEDHEALQFKQEDGQIFWDVKKDYPKEVEMGPQTLTLISERLKLLSDRGQLTMPQLALYEKFVEGTGLEKDK